MSAYSSNVISLLFTPLWGGCRHRDDNPCWDSVASSRQIWMLNPLAKHHSQSELAMINNPTREIWLGGMEAGDLREWVTAMSLLSGLSQIGNHTPRKHEMFIWLMSDVFCKHGWVVTQKLGLWHGAIKWKLSCECVSQLQTGRVHAYAHLFFRHIVYIFALLLERSQTQTLIQRRRGWSPSLLSGCEYHDEYRVVLVG